MTPGERLSLFIRSRTMFVLNIKRLNRKFLPIYTLFKSDIKTGTIIAYSTGTLTFKLGLIKRIYYGGGLNGGTSYTILPIKINSQIFGTPEHINYARIAAVFKDK